MAGAIIAPGLPEMSEFFKGTAPDVYVKAILTMPAIGIVLFSAAIGGIADRIGRKNTLLIALLVYGIAGVSGLIIDNIYALLLSRFVLGIAVAGIMNSGIALVGDYFEAQKRAQFLGLQASFMSIGGIVFLNIGGYLAEWSWRGPFGLYAIAFFIIPLAIYFLPKVKNSPLRTSQNAINKTLSQKDKFNIYKVFYLGFIGMLFFYLIPVQVPYLLKNKLQFSALAVGLAISISTLSAALISLFFQKIAQRITPAKIYTLTFLFISLGYFLIGLNINHIALYTGLALAGIGTGLMMPNGNFILLAILPESIKAKWLGGLTTSIFLGQFLSPLCIAPWISQNGIESAFILAAVLSLLLSGILTFSNTHFTPGHFISKK